MPTSAKQIRTGKLHDSKSSFTLYITFKCLLLHVYALSCNGILDFLCTRCCVTLLLEMYIVQLGVRTFCKLLAFSPGLLLHRISFCVFYFCTVPDAIKLLLLVYAWHVKLNAKPGQHWSSIKSLHKF